MVIQLPAYPSFQIVDDPSVASKWEDWLEGFKAQIGAMKVPETEQKAMLYHYIGGDVRKLLKKLPGGEDCDYDTALELLNEYLAPQMNRVYLMNTLQQVKLSGETTDSFYMRVKEKMSYLELSKMKIDEITELLTLSQLVNNTDNTALRKKALRDGLDLKTFLGHARAYERADQQSKEIEKATSGKSEVKDVNAIHECRPNQRTGQYRGKTHSPRTGADGLRPHQGLKARGAERNRSQRKHATGVVEVSRTQANAQPSMLNATTATKEDTTPRSALQRKSQ